MAESTYSGERRPKTDAEALFVISEHEKWLGKLNEALGLPVEVLELKHQLSHDDKKAKTVLKVLRGRVINYTRTLKVASRATKLLTLGIGIYRIVKATREDDPIAAAAAVADTGVHGLMLWNPFTAILDGVLSLIFGINWPSKILLAPILLPTLINSAFITILHRRYGLVAIVSNASRNVLVAIVVRAIVGNKRLLNPASYHIHQLYGVSAAVKSGPDGTVVLGAVRTLVKVYRSEVRTIMAQKKDPDRLLTFHSEPMGAALRPKFQTAVESARVLSMAGTFINKAHKNSVPKSLTSAERFLNQPFNKGIDQLAINRVIYVAGGPHYP